MKELTLAATVENIEVVTDFVNELLEAADCTMRAQMQIDIAIDEIFSNIARYSYAPDTGEATVRVELDQDLVTITFIDGGMPYNPLENEDPDIGLSAEERQVGGLGVFMVKKSMDNTSYEHKEGKNMFTIQKKIH